MPAKVIDENNATDAVNASATKTEKLNGNAGRNRLLLPALLLGVLSVAVAAYFIYGYVSTHESTDNAFIDSHSTAVGSRIKGIVNAVYVEQDQYVKEGDLLAKLDARDYQVKVEQSQAQVKYAQRQVEQLQASQNQAAIVAQAQQTQAHGEIGSSQARLSVSRAGIVQSQAALEQSKMQVVSMQARQRQAALDWARYQKLDKNGAVSRREFEQAKTALDDADAQLAAACQALKWAEMKVVQSRLEVNQVGGELKRSYGQAQAARASFEQEEVVGKQKLAAVAALEQAQAKLKQDLLSLSYCEIRAPITGRVGKKNLEVGQHLNEGEPLLSIFGDRPWVTANFKETQVGRMQAGQTTEVKVDSFPGVVFEGKIASIAPASGAKYALLPPENATGNFTKIVQRIPVKVELEQQANSQYFARLAPGMSCEVTVNLK